MKLDVPKSILSLPPGRMVATPIDTNVVFYIREEDWGMRKYPRQCPVELQLGTWEIDNVCAAVLLVRLARSDATTFESWVNAGDPNGVRTLQCLASQARVEVHIVPDTDVRSLRVPNSLRVDASYLVNTIRSRDAWAPEAFQRACARVSQLYPTPHSLWWACQEAGKS